MITNFAKNISDAFESASSDFYLFSPQNPDRFYEFVYDVAKCDYNLLFFGDDLFNSPYLDAADKLKTALKCLDEDTPAHDSLSDQITGIEEKIDDYNKVFELKTKFEKAINDKNWSILYNIMKTPYYLGTYLEPTFISSKNVKK